MNWDSLFYMKPKVRIPVFLLAVGIGAVLSRQTDSFQNGPTLCLFKLSTGLECPFCGTTRSICEILQADFSAAAGSNLFGFLVVALATAWALNPVWVTNAYERVRDFRPRTATPLQWVLLISLAGYSITKFTTENF